MPTPRRYTYALRVHRSRMLPGEYQLGLTAGVEIYNGSIECTLTLRLLRLWLELHVCRWDWLGRPIGKWHVLGQTQGAASERQP